MKDLQVKWESGMSNDDDNDYDYGYNYDYS